MPPTCRQTGEEIARAARPACAGREIVVSHVLLAALLGLACGCSRPKPVPASTEIDWGTAPIAESSPPRRDPAAEPKPPVRPGAGRGGPDGGGEKPGAGERPETDGKAGEGDAASGGGGAGDRSDGGSGGGAGGGRGGGAGAGADDTASTDQPEPEAEAKKKPPPPALPGRGPRRPAMSPEDAAANAGRLLDRARGLLREGERVQAAEVAIEAYEMVLPHASTNAACGTLCGELDRLLEAADGRGGAGAVPTRFE